MSSRDRRCMCSMVVYGGMHSRIWIDGDWVSCAGDFPGDHMQ